jgi:RimJ/RimL family protein N-acetyltransferase
MLRGDLVGLRARAAADVPVLHEAFHDDIALWSRIHGEPWRPLSAEAEDGPYTVGRSRGDQAEFFSIVTLADDVLVGSALIWGIDAHNRTAHLGVALLPAVQGRGLGTDAVNVLCRYGFVVRSLRRLQLETLADNHAMIGSATRAGFTLEGTLRGAAWVEGEILDEVIYGLLAEDWPAPETM